MSCIDVKNCICYAIFVANSQLTILSDVLCRLIRFVSHEEKQMELHGKGSPDSKRKGHISESVIVTRFLQCGYVVLTPFGGSERYDLAIEDIQGKLWRIHC